MMMNKLLTLSAFMMYGLMNANSAIAASWNEAVQGELSSNALAPSTLTLDLGSNSVIGSFNPQDVYDPDYLTVIVATGTQLSGLLYGSNFVINDARSFIGVDIGTIVDLTPTPTSQFGLHGYAHIPIGSAVGTNFLPEIGNGFGSQGFTGPLAAGTYTFWMQETSGALGTYSWDFVVSTAPVPEPESYAMLLAGLGMLGFVSRKKQAKKHK
jgi:hypothetical protein